MEIRHIEQVVDVTVTEERHEIKLVEQPVEVRHFDELRVVTLVSNDAHYEHTQAIASTTWVINHNLGKHPAVVIVDSAGTVVYGRMTYNSSNQITISFSASFGGKAYCN